MQTAKVTVYGS